MAMREFAARGRTVLFATHYLEEADANADRAVLVAGGLVVADGPTTEIKARVGTRTIRATLPETDSSELQSLPGVGKRRSPWRCRHPPLHRLRCLRSGRWCGRYPAARDIEIAGAATGGGFPRAHRRADRGARRRVGRARRRACERTSLHPLRAAANVSQPPLLPLLVRFPARALFPHRRTPEGTPTTSPALVSPLRSTTWWAWRRLGRWPR